MLLNLTFNKDWRCFNKGDYFTFKPGVNLLVGDQGKGKSSLIKTIREYGEDNLVSITTSKPTKTASFDFEKDNLRSRGTLVNNSSGLLKLQVASLWSSHGQSVNSILTKLDEVDADCILMDEPDMALSIRSICKLAKLLKQVGENKQIIAAVHNPYLIQEFEEVLDLETKGWISSNEFIEGQLYE